MKSRSKSRAALTLMLATALVMGATAAGKNSSIPVTATIADTANDYPLRIQSDGQGGYVNTRDITSVIAVSQPGTDWILTTYNARLAPSHRTVLFELTEPVSTDNPPPPIGSGYVQSHLIAKCRLVGVDMRQIPVGSAAQCPGTFRFQAFDGRWYRISFNPANHPHVDYLSVGCLASDAAGCRRWAITPSGTTLTGGDPNPKNVGRLLRIDPQDTSVIEELGDYYMSFSITVTR